MMAETNLVVFSWPGGGAGDLLVVCASASVLVYLHSVVQLALFAWENKTSLWLTQMGKAVCRKETG